VDTVEAYFDAHSTSSVLTSDRTLSRLDHPRMDHEALAGVLCGLENAYKDECSALLAQYRSQYEQWMFMLWLVDLFLYLAFLLARFFFVEPKLLDEMCAVSSFDKIYFQYLLTTCSWRKSTQECYFII
jgi:hypothetical protein